MPDLTVTNVAVAGAGIFVPSWVVWITATVLRIDRRLAVVLDRLPGRARARKTP